MPNITQITPPRVPIVDQRTGGVTREWYRYFYNLYYATGGTTGGAIPVDRGGTGTTQVPTNGQILVGDESTNAYNVTDLGTGPGIDATVGPGTLSIENTGVLSNIAGSGISVDQATGNVTISNNGVLSFSGDGTGLTPATATTGDVTLGGVLNETHGGTNQSTYATGDTLYASAANTLSKLGKPSALSFMKMTSAGVPSWEPFAYGSFYDTTTQVNGDSGIPYPMRLNTTDLSNGVTVQARTAVVTASIGPASTTLTCTAITSGRFYPGMLLSGTGVTAGTSILVQLTSTAITAASPTLVSGGTAGTATFVASSVTGIELRQFVTGTHLPAGTRVIDIDSGTNTVTLSANFQAGGGSGTYTFKPWGYQGTYTVSDSQTVASTTITGSTDSKITVANDGVYNVQFSAQIDRTNSGTDIASIWFTKNGVDIAQSCSDFTISGGPAASPIVAVVNLFIPMTAGDYVEIIWSTPDTHIELQSKPVRLSPYRPAVPSVIVTVNMVAPS